MFDTLGTVCPHRGCPRESCHLAAQLKAHNYNNEVDSDNGDDGDCEDAGDDDWNGCNSYGEDDEDLTCRQCFNRTSTTHYQISMAQTLAMAIMMILLLMLSMRMKDYDGELLECC